MCTPLTLLTPECTPFSWHVLEDAVPLNTPTPSGKCGSKTFLKRYSRQAFRAFCT